VTVNNILAYFIWRECFVQEIALVLLKTCKFEVFLDDDDMQIRCVCSVHQLRSTKTLKAFLNFTHFCNFEIPFLLINCIVYNFVDIFTNASTWCYSVI
jgi:hypothetical protein